MAGAIKVISAAGGSVSIQADDTLTTDEVLIVGEAPQVPQAWVDVKAERVIGTTYTNDTGKVIQISTSFIQPTIEAEQLSLIVEGVIISVIRWQDSGLNNAKSIYATIPVGNVYRVDSASDTATINTWTELR